MSRFCIFDKLLPNLKSLFADIPYLIIKANAYENYSFIVCHACGPAAFGM